MKTYSGRAQPLGCEVKIVHDDGKVRNLPLRLDLFNHSPTGFAWGYAGSGPAQLALALLADALHHGPTAVRLHQRFKRKYVAAISQDAHWQMTEDEVVKQAAEIAELPLMRMPDGVIRSACVDCVGHLRDKNMVVADHLGIYGLAPGVTMDECQRAVKGQHAADPDFQHLEPGPTEH